MKCLKCGYEAPVSEFIYLYNARIDAAVSLRRCPQCSTPMTVDELMGEAIRISNSGDATWGKSTGIEGLAEEVRAEKKK